MIRIRMWAVPLFAIAGLTGCASAPLAPQPLLMPEAASGMVIATVSCHFTAQAEAAEAPMLMRFERLDRNRTPHYMLLARLDRPTQRGFVAGQLPEGAYLLREASVGAQRLAVSGLPMPFEVRPGQVTDLGHYRFAPATISAIYTGSRP